MRSWGGGGGGGKHYYGFVVCEGHTTGVDSKRKVRSLNKGIPLKKSPACVIVTRLRFILSLLLLKQRNTNHKGINCQLVTSVTSSSSMVGITSCLGNRSNANFYTNVAIVNITHL